MKFLFILFLAFYTSCYCQELSKNQPLNFGGAITITNNGISLLPNLTLGKPASIFDMTVGNDKLKFEPQLRFSLEGKPWTFVFWLRHKLINKEKFKITIGAHPAFTFREEVLNVNSINKEYITTRRFVASEIAPNYQISKKLNLGLYYLYSHGIEKDVVQNTHFVAFSSKISNLKIVDQVNLKLIPQFYYLKMDKNNGVYANATITLERKKFPITISSILNKKIHSSIPGKEFLWNINLTYTFNKNYYKI